MFAHTAPAFHAPFPAAIPCAAFAASADAPAEDGSSVSPYLRRPLRSLKEAGKARERNAVKRQDKEPVVSDRQ